MSNTSYAILKKDGKDVAFILASDLGVFYREDGYWIRMEDEDSSLPFELEELEWIDADSEYVKVWDEQQRVSSVHISDS